LPGVSNFLELNVRTYAYDRHGRPGAWFYSLDANCWPAVIGARWSYHLPYRWARMSFDRDASARIRYTSRRRSGAQASATTFEYAPRGAATVSHDPRSIEFFLIERYNLFASRKGTLYSGRVHHAPYETSLADVARWDAHLLRLNNLPAPNREPDHVAYSGGVRVNVFGLRRVG
jgi:uncharacterized protein YqjF (DUF2071 family)